MNVIALRTRHCLEVIDLAQEPAALVQQPLHPDAYTAVAPALQALHWPLGAGWVVKTPALSIRARDSLDASYTIGLRDPVGRPHFFRARYVDLYPWLHRLAAACVPPSKEVVASIETSEQSSPR